MSKKIKLKIRGEKIDCGGGTGRYDFSISPLIPDSGVFKFMRYCLLEDIDKKNEHNNRKAIAKDLRVKHTANWERYHRWADEL